MLCGDVNSPQPASKSFWVSSSVKCFCVKFVLTWLLVARTINGTIRWCYTHVDVCFVSQREALVTIVLFTNTIRSVVKHRVIWISPHNFATFIQSISEWKKWSFSYETTRVRWLILTCPVKWQVKPWRNGFLSSISHYIALLFLSISFPLAFLLAPTSPARCNLSVMCSSCQVFSKDSGNPAIAETVNWLITEYIGRHSPLIPHSHSLLPIKYLRRITVTITPLSLSLSFPLWWCRD